MKIIRVQTGIKRITRFVNELYLGNDYNVEMRVRGELEEAMSFSQEEADRVIKLLRMNKEYDKFHIDVI